MDDLDDFDKPPSIPDSPIGDIAGSHTLGKASEPTPWPLRTVGGLAFICLGLIIVAAAAYGFRAERLAAGVARLIGGKAPILYSEMDIPTKRFVLAVAGVITGFVGASFLTTSDADWSRGRRTYWYWPWYNRRG